MWQLCSDLEMLRKCSKEIEAFWLTKGYDRKTLKQASEKALVTPRSETLTYKVKMGYKHPPMVDTHDPCNPPLKQGVAELQRDMIISNDWMRKVLPDYLLITERNCKSLKKHLMPTRLPDPLDAVTENFKCDTDRSKCLICQQYLVETGNSEVREQARYSQSDTGWLAIPPTSCAFSILTLEATPNTSGKQKTVWGPQYQHKHRRSCHQNFHQLTEPPTC